MEHTNHMVLEVESRSCNEGLARIAVAAFCTQLNPTLEEVADVKTAVSEAITNCIVHAYEKETDLCTAYGNGADGNFHHWLLRQDHRGNCS